ncbi:MAG: flagellar hook-length control protein FliK [Afipia sp.]|nr:flagellar hook-length control protein FliK [Afipia sp.]
MSVAINPIFPTISAQGVTPGAVLQPGSVVDAAVLKVLDANLVRIAIANLSIDVLSEVPLKAGQTLQLAVSQTEQGVKLAIVPQQSDGDAAPSSLSAGASPAASPSSSPGIALALDDAPTVQQPATTVAPNIAAPKIAPQIDAPVDPRAVRPLTSAETIVVAAATQAAAAKQASLSPLFANLNVAATLQSLPPALQEAAAKLLAVRPALSPDLTGDDVKVAFEKSGLFLEQSLAAKAGAADSRPPSLAQNVSASNEAPDLKAALIVFRQTVASWLGDAAEIQAPATPSATPVNAASVSLAQPSAETADVPLRSLPQAANAIPQQTAQPQPGQTGQAFSPSIVPGQRPVVEYDEILLPQASIPVADENSNIDPKIQIYAPSDSLPIAIARATAANSGLTSLQEVLQAFPKGVRDAVASLLAAEANSPHAALNSALGAKSLAVPSDTTDIPPPPFRGAAPSAQPVANASIGNDAEPVAVAKHLVDDADAAIARQTLLQVASLPDRADVQMRPDATIPRWNFEIPFATPQGTAVAQFEISRDGGGVSVDAAKKVWKARFSLNVEPTGPVHAQVTLSGDRASVRMWAERPQTAAQLRASAPQLTHALREAALEPGDIVIGDGAPPQPAKPTAGHFLDRAL